MVEAYEGAAACASLNIFPLVQPVSTVLRRNKLA